MTEHTIVITIRHGHGRIEAEALDPAGTIIAHAAGYSLGYALGCVGDQLANKLHISTSEDE